MTHRLLTKTAVLVLAAGLLCTSAFAHRMGVRKFRCPLDGTAFNAVQDISGTSFGTRLDLKKVGPIAQPSKLAQCPQCRLPLYKDTFDPAELTKLKEIIRGGRFAEETRDATAYFIAGVIMEELKESPFEIGWVYLNASWEVEIDKYNYANVCKRSIAWMDKAASSLEKQEDGKEDYLIAKYLPIELSRRIGDFAAASRRLDDFPKTRNASIEWLDDALKQQAILIKTQDLEPHLISRGEEKTAPVEPRPR